MGLEAATYIHQLNPLNPVGAVDPKAQGDDHLRMIKSALQATFPNITGAMTVTQANLNQWGGLAAAYNWSGQHLHINGSAGAPTFSFVSDPDTGIYRRGVNDLAIAIGGVQANVFSATQNVFGIAPTYFTDGAVGAPSISFNNDTDTGFYNGGTNTIVAAVGAAQAQVWTPTLVYIDNNAAFRVSDGNAGAPGLGFTGDPDTGFYRWGIDSFGATSGGAVVMSWRLGQTRITDGLAGTPALTFENDTDTGFYRATSGDLRVTCDGTLILAIRSNANGQIVAKANLAVPDGTAGSPGYNFENDTDTGLYRISSDVLGFSEGGTGYRVGFRSIPRSTTTTTLASTDEGRCVAVSAAINIPASVFGAGTAISIYNDSAAAVNITISAGTLRLAGTGTTGTRTLAARGIATLWFNVGGATPEVICSGAGVT